MRGEILYHSGILTAAPKGISLAVVDRVRVSPAPRSTVQSYSDWLWGTILAGAACALYLAVCPPLYDIDGYPDRLDAIGSDALSNFQPHHLLWQPIQVALVNASAALGHPTPYPFQLFGILVNCTTLCLLFVLLSRCSDDRVFAAVGTVFVALSPEFWYLGFQNRPYTLMFLGIVVLLLVWRTDDGRPPISLALTAAILASIVFLQQAMIFLVPAGAIALAMHDTRPLGQRAIRIAIWCAAIAAVVLAVYLSVWSATVDEGTSFFHWITEYEQEEHGYGLIDIGPAREFAKSAIGISAALVQTDQLQDFLADHFSANLINLGYGLLGIAVCAAAMLTIRRAQLGQTMLQLLRTNSLFAFSALSILLWSAFVFAWEPATSHFWPPDIFLALVCIGLLMRERQIRARWALVACMVPLVAWNAYFNLAYDRTYSRNFPEPLVKSIDQTLRAKDIFIVLGHNNWFGSMDYDLLFQTLAGRSHNPGLAILDDFVLQPDGSRTWRERLRAEIESTMNSGGRVFLAQHVLDPDSFEDLDGSHDAFSPFINKHYLDVDADQLQRELTQFFDGYELTDSPFAIGLDKYYLLERKEPDQSKPALWRYKNQSWSKNVNSVAAPFDYCGAFGCLQTLASDSIV
jgi:hypothetical protein